MRKVANAHAFVRRSASITLPGVCTKGDHATSDKIAEELGRAHNVFRLLERDRIKRHVDGRLGVGVDNCRGVENDAKVDKKIANEEDIARSHHGTKTSDSALESDTERCICENQ